MSKRKPDLPPSLSLSIGEKLVLSVVVNGPIHGMAHWRVYAEVLGQQLDSFNETMKGGEFDDVLTALQEKGLIFIYKEKRYRAVR